MKTYHQFAVEAYDRSSGRPHRGTDYKGRDYGGSEEEHKSNVRFGKKMADLQGGWLEREKKKKDVNEAGDWWHPDPKKDRAISGAGNKMRAREDQGKDTSVQKKPDYSNRLKPGETYMQYAKRKEAERTRK